MYSFIDTYFISYYKSFMIFPFINQCHISGFMHKYNEYYLVFPYFVLYFQNHFFALQNIKLQDEKKNHEILFTFRFTLTLKKGTTVGQKINNIREYLYKANGKIA